MEIDDAARQAGAVGDIGHRRFGIAALGQRIDRRLDQLLPPRFLRSLAAFLLALRLPVEIPASRPSVAVFMAAVDLHMAGYRSVRLPSAQMSGTVLAAVKHLLHGLPGADVLVDIVLADCRRDGRVERPSEARSSARATSRYQGLRSVTAMSVKPARSIAGGSGRRSHAEGQPLGLDIGLHVRRRLAVMADHPVRGGEHAARLQHAEDLAEQRVLVGHMQQRILGEDDVEGGVGKRQRPGRRLDEIGAIRQPALSSPACAPRR